MVQQLRLVMVRAHGHGNTKSLKKGKSLSGEGVPASSPPWSETWPGGEDHPESGETTRSVKKEEGVNLGRRKRDRDVSLGGDRMCIQLGIEEIAKLNQRPRTTKRLGSRRKTSKSTVGSKKASPRASHNSASIKIIEHLQRGGNK